MYNESRAQSINPADTRHWPNVGSMLADRLRRRPNIEPTLGQRLVFAGLSECSNCRYIIPSAK